MLKRLGSPIVLFVVLAMLVPAGGTTVPECQVACAALETATRSVASLESGERAGLLAMVREASDKLAKAKFTDALKKLDEYKRRLDSLPAARKPKITANDYAQLTALVDDASDCVAALTGRPPTPVVTAPLVEGATQVRGAALPGATVQVFVNANEVGIATAAADGGFVLTVVPLVAGQQVTARQSVNGGPSEFSAPITVVAVPPPPVITIPLVAGGTTVGGTGTAAAFVEVLIDGSVVGTAIVDGNGAWQVTVSPLVAQSRVRARQGAGGVTSALSSEVVVVARPSPPGLRVPIVAGATSVTGTGTPGGLVELFIQGVAAGTAAVEPTGAWSITTTPLVVGHVIAAFQTVGGVRSEPAQATVVDLPSPPTIDSPLIAGQTAVQGSGLAGATVELFIDETSAGITVVTTSGQWNLSLDAALEEGDRVQATQSVAGVRSPPSPAVIVIGPPPSPVVNAPLFAGDTTVTGTGVAGASLELFVDGGAVGTTSVNQDGTWSLPLGAALIAGQVVTATQTVAGVTSDASDPVVVQGAALVLIDISPAPTASLATGLTLEFRAKGTFSDNSVADPLPGVTWSTGNESVARISTTGVATGQAIGTANIRALRNSIASAATLLTVGRAVVVRLVVGPVNPSVVVNGNVQFTATAQFSDGRTEDVTSAVVWSSSNTAIATMNASGFASALSAGPTTIKATHPDGPSDATTLTVDAVPVPFITLFAPVGGQVGQGVTVTGGNFANVRRISFGGVTAAMTGATSTTLTTFVPIGAQTGRIVVETAAGTATSPADFVVAPRADFELVLGPALGTMARGSATTFVLETAGPTANQFAGLATLRVTGLASGQTANLSSPTITGGQRVEVTIRASNDAALGVSSFIVGAEGTSETGSFTRNATAQVTVVGGDRPLVSGRVTLVDGTPVAGARLTLDVQTLDTDAAGNFLFLDPPPGLLTLSIDAHVARSGLPIYAVEVPVIAGQATVLEPFRLTPPPPAERFMAFANATADQTFEDPRFPGFAITLPAGVTITGWDGTVKTKLAIEKLPLDALPIPAPPFQTRSIFQIFFGTPMGGLPTAPLPVTLPNDLDALPGEQVEIWYYDAVPFPGVRAGWRLAGLGTVSDDGTRVVSNPGVGLERFCGVCGAVCVTRHQEGQPDRNSESPTAGDPVDLVLGQMIVQKTDLVLPGVLPAIIHRTYNPFDAFGGISGVNLGLGPGWALSVDAVLIEVNTSLRRLVMPGNARASFVRQVDGSFTSATPRFIGATITQEAGGIHRLRFRDGTAWRFRTSGFTVGVGFLIEHADRNGNRLVIERDNRGTISRIVEPAGRALIFSYSGARISEIRDPLGRTVRYGYAGPSSRLSTVTDTAGGVMTYAYDSVGRILSITNPRGITYLTNEYDATGRVVRQTQVDGGVWTFEYVGQPTAPTSAIVTDPNGHKTSHHLSPSGSSRGFANPLGQNVHREHDALGRVVAITDALGRTRRFEYDAVGNVTRRIDAAGHAYVFTFEPVFNRLTSVMDPLGNVTRLGYDGRGNLIQITDSVGRISTISYDDFGQPTSAVDPLGNRTRLAYNGQGDVISVTDALGNVRRQRYDLASRLVAHTDARGRTTTFVYDALDRVAEIRDALGGVTRWTHDAAGNVLTITDPRGSAVTQTYDAMDRLASRVDPLGAIETFEYDAVGNLIRATDRKGQVRQFSYDALNRRIQGFYSDGARTGRVYDAAGRLVQLEDSSGGGIVNTYDVLDRVIGQTTAFGSIGYEYDALGRRTQMLPVGQPSVQYSYDTASRLTRIVRDGQAVDLSYDALGRRSRVGLPNGISTEYAYDPASRLIALNYGNAAGSLGTLTYEYDATGTPTRIGGSLARTLLPEPVDAATYDAANRQLQFGHRSMTFDRNGNVTSAADQTGATLYSWDARNRLVGLFGPNLVAGFGYDPYGRRIAAEVNDQRTEFLYDGADIIQEIVGTTAVGVLRSLAIDEVFARGNNEFHLADPLGSRIGLTDGNGALIEQYAYEPFGRTTTDGTSTNRFAYSGREQDRSGLYYYRARYYDPKAGRFLQEDPIFAMGQNLYAYVQNRPTVSTDPFGLSEHSTSSFWTEKDTWNTFHIAEGAHVLHSVVSGHNPGLAIALFLLSGAVEKGLEAWLHHTDETIAKIQAGIWEEVRAEKLQAQREREIMKLRDREELERYGALTLEGYSRIMSQVIPMMQQNPDLQQVWIDKRTIPPSLHYIWR